MGLRAAMIGLGFMGYTHTEAIRRLGGEVIGCLDSSPEATKAGVARLGIPRAYASLEECVADPEVDIVHICTPNYLHYPMTKAALEAGKHVLCEKPLAISSDESAALVRLAREKGLAVLPDRLELAVGDRPGRGDAGRDRHRHTLAGHGHVDDRPKGQRSRG